MKCERIKRTVKTADQVLVDLLTSVIVCAVRTWDDKRFRTADLSKQEAQPGCPGSDPAQVDVRA